MYHPWPLLVDHSILWEDLQNDDMKYTCNVGSIAINIVVSDSDRYYIDVNNRPSVTALYNDCYLIGYNMENEWSFFVLS